MQDWGFRIDLLKPERMGRGEGGTAVEEMGSNSPKRHCPQKAVAAHAATATSRGESRSSCWTSCAIIFALTGGRGGRLDDPGAKLCTPFRTYRKRELPFHCILWATCHALSAESRFRGVLLACLPALEAANAHSTNSLAGNRIWTGTPSTSQKFMYCLIAPE